MLHPRDHHDLADLTDDLAAELGVLSTHVARHVQALPHISRCHVYRIGDGGAHLHVWFFARPEGQAQLFGSWLVVWDDLLPEYPAAVAADGRRDRGGRVGRLVRRSARSRAGLTAAPSRRSQQQVIER